MKRRLIFLVTLVIVQVLNTPSSNAIFGLSGCEKIKKEILIEERIGKKAWKKYDNQRDQYVRSNTMSFQQLSPLINQLTLVYNSDLIVLKKLDKNPKCLTASSSADVRAKIQALKQSENSLEGIRKIYERITFEEQKRLMPQGIIDIYAAEYEIYSSYADKLK